MNKLYKVLEKIFMSEGGPLIASVWTIIAPPTTVGAVIAFKSVEGELSSLLLMTALWFPITLLVYWLAMLVEKIVEWSSQYVTHGDHVIKYFITRCLRNDDNDDHLMKYLAFYTVTFISLAILSLSLYLPAFWILMFICGMVLGLLKLSRFAYGVSKKLNVHTKDSTAHTRGE